MNDPRREAEIRKEAIVYAENQRRVAVHSTGRDGSPCVRVGLVMSVTEKLVFVAGRDGNEFGVPLTFISKISLVVPWQEPRPTSTPPEGSTS